jgi:hypothetical protein
MQVGRTDAIVLTGSFFRFDVLHRTEHRVECILNDGDSDNEDDLDEDDDVFNFKK